MKSGCQCKVTQAFKKLQIVHSESLALLSEGEQWGEAGVVAHHLQRASPACQAPAAHPVLAVYIYSQLQSGSKLRGGRRRRAAGASSEHPAPLL